MFFLHSLDSGVFFCCPVQDGEGGCRKKEKEIALSPEYLVPPSGLAEVALDEIMEAYRFRLSVSSKHGNPPVTV